LHSTFSWAAARVLITNRIAAKIARAAINPSGRFLEPRLCAILIRHLRDKVETLTRRFSSLQRRGVSDQGHRLRVQKTRHHYLPCRALYCLFSSTAQSSWRSRSRLGQAASVSVAIGSGTIVVDNRRYHSLTPALRRTTLSECNGDLSTVIRPSSFFHIAKVPLHLLQEVGICKHAILDVRLLAGSHKVIADALSWPNDAGRTAQLYSKARRVNLLVIHASFFEPLPPFPSVQLEISERLIGIGSIFLGLCWPDRCKEGQDGWSADIEGRIALSPANIARRFCRNLALHTRRNSFDLRRSTGNDVTVPAIEPAVHADFFLH